MIECSHDCFNCPYPDVPEACLNAPLSDQERAIADAEEIGVSEHTVLGWENGYYPANWDLLVGVLPELRRYVSGRGA